MDGDFPSIFVQLGQGGFFMDLKQLEYMVAIAECGNISRAAETLFITQSGLNQQLIKLEKELGQQLFYRNKHYLRTTQAGKLYIDSAKEILRIKKNTYAQLEDLKGNVVGEIALGLTHEHGIDIFTSVFPDFNHRYPGVTFNLLERIVSDQHNFLLGGHLDFGIIMLADSDKIDLEYIKLYNENLVLGIPKKHPMAKYASAPGEPLSTIDLRLFRQDSFSLIFASSTMRKVIDPLFKEAGYQPHILIESAMNHALIQLVSNGFCCTILPQSRVLVSPYSTNCAWFHLSSRPNWNIYVAYRKDMHLNEVHRYFIQLAKHYGNELEKNFL